MQYFLGIFSNEETKTYEEEVPCNKKGYVKYEQRIRRCMYGRGEKTFFSTLLGLIAACMKETD